LNPPDSEYGLSLLTAGRLKDGITPSACSVASIVAPFIGLPLSECKTTWPGAMFSRSQMSRITSAASSLLSVS